MTDPIRNLVFAGGGVRGAAYVGAIQVLEERGHLAGVHRVAGASAGAITAGLLAAGADAATFTRLFEEIDFPSFVDDPGWIVGDAIRLVRGYGIHTGDPLSKWLRDALAEVTRLSLGAPRPEVTLGELAAAALAGKPVRRLFAVTTNLTHQLPEVLCAATTPSLPVWQAMRMSGSFPLVFQAVEAGGCVYVDGGLSWNYPIDLFDGDYLRRTRGRPAPEDLGHRTLGFVLGDAAAVSEVEGRVEISDLRGFAAAFTSFVLNESTKLHTSRDALARTVLVDTLGLSAVDFGITDADERKLVANGRAATEAWLDQVPVETSMLRGSR
ncbi:MAG: patatin-like phospholipase family protein [Myxococcota bacterium]